METTVVYFLSHIFKDGNVTPVGASMVIIGLIILMYWLVLKPILATVKEVKLDLSDVITTGSELQTEHAKTEVKIDDLGKEFSKMSGMITVTAMSGNRDLK